MRNNTQNEHNKPFAMQVITDQAFFSLRARINPQKVLFTIKMFNFQVLRSENSPNPEHMALTSFTKQHGAERPVASRLTLYSIHTSGKKNPALFIIHNYSESLNINFPYVFRV